MMYVVVVIYTCLTSPFAFINLPKPASCIFTCCCVMYVNDNILHIALTLRLMIQVHLDASQPLLLIIYHISQPL